ncbi:MAG: M20/M25/M40 family metallo-hydrolase [Armatimonadetes bacterium]|nr:M20/M25/M40 family metallo-hydrolase [Armatimonadota bacterium]
MLALSLVLLSHVAGPTPAQQIIDLSKEDNRVMLNLKELCFNIGARPTGSPQLQKAEQWALKKFQSFGFKNAHLEKWADVPVGFERGPNNSARMLEPSVADIVFSTNCWMPGTKGPEKGPVVMVPHNMDEFAEVKSQIKGAWILDDAKVTMRGPNTSTEDKETRQAIIDAGALGFVYGCPGENVWTHGTWKDKTYEKHPTTIEVQIRHDNWEMLAENVKAGKKTVAEFNIDNRWIKGPIEVHNVVAEIKGTEHPDEIVVVGGHLDSWNSPGSQGANDNGTGSSSTLEAARLIMKSGLKPKRTIRFILFSGEEEGLLGSTEYVKQHADEIPKVSACIVDDGGSNYENGVSGLAKWAPFFTDSFDAMTKAFPDMPMKFSPVEKYDASGGSDQASFWAKGVPSFFMGKAGTQQYLHIWHTQFDRYDQAIPEYLKQVATSLAVVTFNIANADEMMPRP